MSWGRAFTVNLTIFAVVALAAAIMGAPLWGAWAAGFIVYSIHVAADRVINDLGKRLRGEP